MGCHCQRQLQLIARRAASKTAALDRDGTRQAGRIRSLRESSRGSKTKGVLAMCCRERTVDGSDDCSLDRGRENLPPPPLCQRDQHAAWLSAMTLPRGVLILILACMASNLHHGKLHTRKLNSVAHSGHVEVWRRSGQVQVLFYLNSVTFWLPAFGLCRNSYLL